FPVVPGASREFLGLSGGSRRPDGARRPRGAAGRAERGAGRAAVSGERGRPGSGRDGPGAGPSRQLLCARSPAAAAAVAASEERPASPAVATPCWRVEQFVVAQECTRCSGFEMKTIPACGPTGFIEKINCASSHRDEYKRWGRELTGSGLGINGDGGRELTGDRGRELTGIGAGNSRDRGWELTGSWLGING
uniref:Protein JTB n=1 Tax=Geospiza parvula TaxID=87175 RepID=A0A8U8BLR7_GEOPR